MRFHWRFQGEVVKWIHGVAEHVCIDGYFISCGSFGMKIVLCYLLLIARNQPLLLEQRSWQGGPVVVG